MRQVHEARASAILYDLLLSQERPGLWILPANVCPIVPLTFFKARRAFEFVDIDPATLCMAREPLLSRLLAPGSDPAGVLFVRTYGLARDFDELFAEIKRVAPHVLLVDDRCLCLPSFEPASPPEVDVVLYSTGHAKPVDVGFGGFALIREHVGCDPRRLMFEPRALDALTRAYKQAIERRAKMDYRDDDWLDTRAPALTIEEYRRLVERSTAPALEHRQQLNEIYRTGLGPEIRLPDSFQNWRFHVLVRDKESLLTAIFDQELFASSHYADLCGVFSEGKAPVARRLHERIVNLFNDFYYSAEQAERTAEVVRRHVQSTGSPPNPWQTP